MSPLSDQAWNTIVLYFLKLKLWKTIPQVMERFSWNVIFAYHRCRVLKPAEEKATNDYQGKENGSNTLYYKPLTVQKSLECEIHMDEYPQSWWNPSSHSEAIFTARIGPKDGEGTVFTGVCLSTPGGGTPVPVFFQVVPLARSGWVAPPPPQNSRASTCYVAGSMPLAFTQEDYLVMSMFLN